MTVKELYGVFEERIPAMLREEWDNDGLMCCPDSFAEVRRVFVTLDVTEEIVDYAIERGVDLIVSHHPLIFKPISEVNEDVHVGRKLIKLISNGISVFSFHTRADKASGGVNDLFADRLGISETMPFGEGMMGRLGELDEEMTLEDFAFKVKQLLGSDSVSYADGYNTVKRVALLGGDGKSFVKDAIAVGADTFVSGALSYNVMEEAGEMGINLIEAGHYFTESYVTELFTDIITRADPDIYVEAVDSNMIKII